MRPVHREVAKYEQREADSMEQPSAGDASFSPTRRVGARGGPQLFAQKLFTLVEEEDPDIVEWLPDGLAFRVKDIQRFSNEVLEKYFNRECLQRVCFSSTVGLFSQAPSRTTADGVSPYDISLDANSHSTPFHIQVMRPWQGWACGSYSLSHGMRLCAWIASSFKRNA